MKDAIDQVYQQAFLESSPSCRHLKKDRTKTIDIRASIRNLASQLFRGHIGQCSRGGLRFGEVPDWDQQLSQTKIKHLHLSFRGYHDVGWLQVTMYDAMIVRAGEIVDPLHRDATWFAAKRQARTPAEFTTNAAYLARVKREYGQADLIDRVESVKPGQAWRNVPWPWE